MSRSITLFVALASLAPLHGAAASPLLRPAPLAHEPPSLVETVQRRGAAHGAYVARGPRGGVVAGRGTVVQPGYRPGYRPVPGRPVVVAPGWNRPASYWWRPGAAVAAGAAIGFVTAAAATAYAGSPPASGYCWYYTNPQRTQGFWDVCPR
jgi:hypothetical protein